MSADRRSFLKSLLGAGAAVATAASPVGADERREAPPDAVGLLYDTTKCIGCITRSSLSCNSKIRLLFD